MESNTDLKNLKSSNNNNSCSILDYETEAFSLISGIKNKTENYIQHLNNIQNINCKI